MRWYLLGLLFICNSCFLFSKFKERTFNYSTNGTAQAIPLLVPAGYTKTTETIDSTGNKELYYYYPGGGFIYFVHKVKPKEYRAINEDRHMPLQHPKGGLIYKGMDKGGGFWREIQLENFVFGYNGIGRGAEIKFDSALNFASHQNFK